MKKILWVIPALFGLMLSGAERPVSSTEMMEMQMPSELLKRLPTESWRCAYADKKEFADPDFDDRNWETVNINAPLSGKNRPKNF